MAAPPAPAPAPRLIAAVSFIDRCDRLLFHRTYPTGSAHDPSALELAVFAALDYIHEKTANTLAGPARPTVPGRAAAASNSDLFLNLLYPFGDLKLFGFASATGLKIIVAVKDVLLREDRVRDTFKALQRLYVDAYCNPFTPLEPAAGGSQEAAGGGALAAACPSFDRAVAQLVAQADRAIAYVGPMPL